LSDWENRSVSTEGEGVRLISSIEGFYQKWDKKSERGEEGRLNGDNGLQRGSSACEVSN